MLQVKENRAHSEKFSLLLGVVILIAWVADCKPKNEMGASAKIKKVGGANFYPF
ncbi:MAG TPA: hypothetical protein VE130_11350 [Nitrososphaeraceae archaeon]|nr:hypothetical protein [Nitrososphaeraceae archaeon]